MDIGTGIRASSYSPLGERFRRIEQQFVSVDRRLESNEYYRREVGYNWSRWFHDASNDLSEATRQFEDATRGSARSVSRDLDRAVDLLHRNGDRLRDMEWRNERFGYGWGRVLDDPIRTVREAIRELRRTGDDYWRP